jgi:hypothetical protein
VANTLVTPSIIAKMSLAYLDNELVMKKLVNSDYSDEFTKVGSTINVRRPVQFEVRTGAVANMQAVQEVTVPVVMDQQIGVDFEFSSVDMTLTVEEWGERYAKPAMIQLANKIDRSLHDLYTSVWNWVGTPGSTINSFADYALAPQRLMEGAVPAPYTGTLAPADHYGLAGSFANNVFSTSITEDAIKRARMPNVAGVDTYVTQNVSTLTTGTRTGGAPLTNGTTQTTTFLTSGGAFTQSLICDGFTAGNTIAAGDVFTLGTLASGMVAVNPVTKVSLGRLQQFTVVSTSNTADGGGNVTLTVSPPIITSGPQQTVSMTSANTDGLALTFLGSASTGYAQNMVFNKDAFLFVSRPMWKPEGAVNVAQQSYKGISARVIPTYDGINDTGGWRFDVLYGVKAVYPHLACRVSGT